MKAKLQYCATEDGTYTEVGTIRLVKNKGYTVKAITETNRNSEKETIAYKVLVKTIPIELASTFLDADEWYFRIYFYDVAREIRLGQRPYSIDYDAKIITNEIELFPVEVEFLIEYDDFSDYVKHIFAGEFLDNYDTGETVGQPAVDWNAVSSYEEWEVDNAEYDSSPNSLYSDYDSGNVMSERIFPDRITEGSGIISLKMNVFLETPPGSASHINEAWRINVWDGHRDTGTLAIDLEVQEDTGASIYAWIIGGQWYKLGTDTFTLDAWNTIEIKINLERTILAYGSYHPSFVVYLNDVIQQLDGEDDIIFYNDVETVDRLYLQNIRSAPGNVNDCWVDDVELVET
ncbi:MAG: hypothetical protein V3W20_03775 [Candidatus Neomarinimicrobiota bacterium]